MTTEPYLYRTLELSLGVICGCMPYLAGFFKRQRPKMPQLSSMRGILSYITSVFTSRSRHHRSSSKSSELIAPSDKDPYLETHILGSVKGGGKFVQSGVYPQKAWLDETTESRRGQDVSTIRETLEY